jgi:site-specific DNA-methyltransferase (adenine-specific)
MALNTHYSADGLTLYCGDVNEQMAAMPAQSVQCCVTSPPYWALRDYGVAGQLGLEKTPEEYIANMVNVFRGVKRVLRDDGTLWLNIGDSYAHKSLVGIPWLLAFALRSDGWYLRSEIIWHKRSPMPESCRDRPTKAHEQIFLLTKSPKYFYDTVASAEPALGTTRRASPKYALRDKKVDRASAGARMLGGVTHRNMRSVWTLSSRPYKGAHFATFPPDLVERCLKAGTSEFGACPQCGAAWMRETEKRRIATRPGTGAKPSGEEANRDPERHITRVETTGVKPACKCAFPAIDPYPGKPAPCVVFDPFNGAGTTGAVAQAMGRHYVGVELNPSYCDLSVQRWQGPRVKLAKAA